MPIPACWLVWDTILVCGARVTPDLERPDFFSHDDDLMTRSPTARHAILKKQYSVDAHPSGKCGQRSPLPFVFAPNVQLSWKK